jgi:hypothetical protein
VDKHLSLPSLYSYRLAIGYFRVVKGGGGSYPWFPSELGGHGLSLRFGFLHEKSSLVRLAGRWGRLQPRVPREATQTPGYVMELKLVWFEDM